MLVTGCFWIVNSFSSLGLEGAFDPDSVNGTRKHSKEKLLERAPVFVRTGAALAQLHIALKYMPYIYIYASIYTYTG